SGSTALAVSQRTGATTYPGASTSFAVLELVAAVGLALSTALLLSERATATLGVLALAAEAAWLAPLWVGWEGGPSLVRSAGLVAAPLLPGAVLAVAASVPPRPRAPAVLAGAVAGALL